VVHEVVFAATAFPLGALAVLLGAYPLVTLVLWIFRRRIPIGHCQNCGYDLTANITGIRPE